MEYIILYKEYIHVQIVLYKEWFEENNLSAIKRFFTTVSQLDLIHNPIMSRIRVWIVEIMWL